MECGQIVADRQDRESFLARLGLSLADTARLLGVSSSGIAKAVARAERPLVH
jgi:plasmid maintenance system antidote protein VapI